MSRITIAILCCLLLALVAAPQTQVPQTKPPQTKAPQTKSTEQTDQSGARFTSTSNEVIVPVTATDEKGKFISNLEAKDFRILDEGRPQRISFFSHNERQPVVIGFLVDLSNNSRIHWGKYQDAILELVWNLLPGDKKYSGYLISYANDAELQVNTTSDSEKLADKIRKMKPGGGSSLFDAIYKACTTRSLVQGEPYEPRRIIIIIGDGKDNASKKSMGEVLELAQRNLITIYAMSTMAFGFTNEDRDVLERLTTETGGHVEYPLNENIYKDISGYLSNPQDAGNYALTVGTGGYAAEISKGIFQAITGISGEITTQYVLRYVPDVDDPKAKPFRRIKVEIPTLPNAKVRFRTGYYPRDVPGAIPGAQ